IQRQNLLRFRIDNAHAHSWQWMANCSPARCHLAEAGSAEIAAIYCNHRSALSTAVAFQRTNSKNVFKLKGCSLRQLFRSDQHVLQAAKMLRRTTPHVGLKKCRRSDQESDAVLGDQFTDGRSVERVGMEDHTNSMNRRQPQSNGETKRMEERK